MASVAIKYQESPFALAFFRIFIEVLDPFETEPIISPSIIAYGNFPGNRNAGLVPCRLVKLAIEDDKGRYRLPSYANGLDRCNLLPVSGLLCP